MYIRREISLDQEMKISCVIITFNEEKNIKRCLESVEGVVDEIVVVDSFSIDRTKEICEEHGVRFIEHSFDGMIEQKNYALSQAKYSHVLSLDADEALSDALKQSIIKVKKYWKSDGYYFNRITNYCGKWIKHCGWYPDQKLRLWDRRQGEFGGVNPHDEVKMDGNTEIQYIKGDLLHYSYYTISEHIDQVNKFTEIGANEAIARSRNSNLMKILVNPIWKFLRDYFFKLGFLDGYYGFIVCMISAHATFIKYIKMKELQK